MATRALVSYPGSGNTWIRYLIGFRYNGDDDGGDDNYDDDHHHHLNRQREPLDFTLAAFLMTRASWRLAMRGKGGGVNVTIITITNTIIITITTITTNHQHHIHNQLLILPLHPFSIELNLGVWQSLNCSLSHLLQRTLHQLRQFTKDSGRKISIAGS